MRSTIAVFALSLMFLTTVGFAQEPESQEQYQPKRGQKGKDVIWLPTSWERVGVMLDLANVTRRDTVVDLGSGDGRIVIGAALRGAQARGIEYNPDMVDFARRSAVAAGVSDSATFVEADIFESDYSDATVVTLYLLTSLNERLRPTLLSLKPGTRIVSYTFSMGEWQPDKSSGSVRMWLVPANIEGAWQFPAGIVHFQQQFQEIAGEVSIGDESFYIFHGRVRANRVSFTANGVKYTGWVKGDTMSGKDWEATRLAEGDSPRLDMTP